MKTIIGVFSRRGDAENAVEELRNLGVANDYISYIAMDTAGNITRETDTSLGADDAVTATATGAVTGGLVGAIAGLVVANGILPGLGTLFVAGPVAVALGLTGAAATAAAGTMTGAAAGGLMGALGTLGVDASAARIYEARIKRGEIAIATTIDSVDEHVASDIFRNNGAEETHIYSGTES